MTAIAGFIIGLAIGAVFGALGIALCVAADRGDRRRAQRDRDHELHVVGKWGE